MDSQIAEIIADEQNIDLADFEQRKRFLMINDADVERIKAFGRSLPQIPESMFDFFYEHLHRFPETKSLLKDSEVVASLKQKQMTYFKQLLEGNYDWDYMLSRLAVGYVHVEMGVVPLWYVGAFGKYLEQIKGLTEQYADEPQLTYESLFKVILLDIVLTLESYHYTKYKLYEELKIMAATDQLTGAYNRRKMLEIMKYEMQRAQRQEAPLALIMLDIDHFKHINDTYGHQEGDQVLIKLSDLVHSNLRGTDFLIRFGGEEFLVVLPAADLAEACEAAERLRHLVAQKNFSPVERVRISLGVAQLREGDTMDSVIKRADDKLYEAKQGGRDQVRW